MIRLILHFICFSNTIFFFFFFFLDRNVHFIKAPLYITIDDSIEDTSKDEHGPEWATEGNDGYELGASVSGEFTVHVVVVCECYCRRGGRFQAVMVYDLVAGHDVDDVVFHVVQALALGILLGRPIAASALLVLYVYLLFQLGHRISIRASGNQVTFAVILQAEWGTVFRWSTCY